MLRDVDVLSPQKKTPVTISAICPYGADVSFFANISADTICWLAAHRTCRPDISRATAATDAAIWRTIDDHVSAPRRHCRRRRPENLVCGKHGSLESKHGTQSLDHRFFNGGEVENFSGFHTLHSYEDEGHFSRDGVDMLMTRGVLLIRRGVKILYGANLECGEIVRRQACMGFSEVRPKITLFHFAWAPMP